MDSVQEVLQSMGAKITFEEIYLSEVMPNLYGNIIDNLAVGLIVGAGLVGAASFSSELAVFEPGARHSFDEATGKNIANPTATLLAAGKMMEHVGFSEDNRRLVKGVEKVLRKGKVRTRDLGGYATTREFTAAVCKSIKNVSPMLDNLEAI